MKINELDIQNIRGIKELKLSPNGKNFVVWGKNGAGKSAVVDAIDFLLKGEIIRLTGPGTKEITLKKHGPHIDCKDLSKSFIKAVITIDGADKPFEISRCLEKPQSLIYPAEYESMLIPILEVANLGQHILTRREILRFITSKGGERAEQIQNLLNLSNVELIRKAIGRVISGTDRDLKSTQRNLQEDRAKIISRVGITNYEVKEILEFVNEKRKTLGGDSIDCLKNIKSNLTPISSHKRDQTINISSVEQDFANLCMVNNASVQKEIIDIHLNLKSLVSSIHDDATALKIYSSQQLVRLGLESLDGSGKCPLCDKEWDDIELKEYLEGKLASVSGIRERFDVAKSESDKLLEKVNYLLISLDRIIRVLEKVELENVIGKLDDWNKGLLSLKTALEDPITKYHAFSVKNEQIQNLLIPDFIKDDLSKALALIKEKYPEMTPEQIAWDSLTELGVELEQEMASQLAIDDANLVHQRALILKNEFEKARDEILGDLYESIKDRFVQLYRALHSDDESQFDASLTPSGPSLDFEVDFYGRGKHPPQAMHSEGHQDSMGVCLFLALSEKLSDDLMDLIILDDVVMSVDSNHRRQLCELLNCFFPNKQFLITTHDRVWAMQMKQNGVIDKDGLLEFFDWTIDTGPHVNDETDLWDRIAKDLTLNDVPSAAAKLRRGAEQHFAEICHSIQAKVPFNIEGNYDLGDLLTSALNQFKNILSEAIKVHESWQGELPLDNDGEKELVFLDKDRKEKITRLTKEQWSINPNIHYNEWADFEKKDFEPVVAGFKNLIDMFYCKTCGSLIRVIPNMKNPQNVRCNCGNVNWNMVKKK